MTATEETREGMQSVLRALDVLEAVARKQPVGLSELARGLHLPKTTVQRILRTLAGAGWLAPHGEPGDQRWRLTPRALAVGSNIMNHVDLREVARPVMTELAVQTSENIHLSVPDDGMLVLIDKIPSGRPVQTVAHVGERVPMYLTASGWAYLSRLSPAEAGTLLPAILTATTDLSVIDREQLAAELRTVAERGYSVNPGRWRADVAAIGSAIVDSRGRPIAALSISMPSYRLTDDLHEPYGRLVRQATADISVIISRMT